MGARIVRPSIFDVKGICIFPTSERVSLEFLAALLSTHGSSLLLRVLTQSLEFHSGYVDSMPVGRAIESIDILSSLGAYCIASKKKVVETDLIEASYVESIPFLSQTVTMSLLHSAEGVIETRVAHALGFKDDLLEWLIRKTGIPCGWFPLLQGYDEIPSDPQDMCKLAKEVYGFLEKNKIIKASSQEIADYKNRLHDLYSYGPGGKDNAEMEERAEEEENKKDEEEEKDITRGCIPIPSETFIEELSQDLRIHPISIYWLLKEGIENEGWRCLPEERRLTADRFTVIMMRLLGHRWPKQIETGKMVPEWADEDGIIPITEGAGETILLSRVRERIGVEFKEGEGIEREFAEVMEKPLEQWLETEFFKHHTKQFKKRPIAWQIQSGSYSKKRKPAYAAMLYYHKLDGDILPKISSQQIGLLGRRLETEMRMIEAVPANSRSDRQERRRRELEDSIQELKDFEAALQKVSEAGFHTPGLQQFAIDDAILCLKATWLRRLNEVIKRGALAEWRKLADETYLECPLADWIEEAMAYLDHFCSAVGPKAPEGESLKTDPDSAFLASLIAPQARSMVNRSIELACDKWWKQFDEAMLSPLRDKIRSLKEEIKRKKEEIKELQGVGTNHLFELNRQVSELEFDFKKLQGELGERSEKGKEIRKIIEEWTCPEAETWEGWLATQPMYDAISSLVGKRTPPKTVEEFVRQEAFYAPDINDGVRVNIAPIQKAGLLAADVLAKKDLHKPIADRAEWRSDERRWCREGKLPQPGWWALSAPSSQGNGNPRNHD